MEGGDKSALTPTAAEALHEPPPDRLRIASCCVQQPALFSSTGLRGLAALAIVVFHIWWYEPAPYPLLNIHTGSLMRHFDAFGWLSRFCW